LVLTFAEKEKEYRHLLNERDAKISTLYKELEECYMVKRSQDPSSSTGGEHGIDSHDTVVKLQGILEQKSAEVCNMQSVIREQRRQLNKLQGKLTFEQHEHIDHVTPNVMDLSPIVTLQRKLLEEKAEEIQNLGNLVYAQKEQLGILNQQLGKDVRQTSSKKSNVIHVLSVDNGDYQSHHTDPEYSSYDIPPIKEAHYPVGMSDTETCLVGTSSARLHALRQQLEDAQKEREELMSRKFV
jgi:hypothetical protein